MPINFIFLEEDDLQTQMFEAYIDNDDADDIAAIEKIEGQQIAKIKTKLRQRFVVDQVFAEVGDDRNQELVNVLAALVCYYMIRRNAARKVPSDYVAEKKWADKWLMDVRDGLEAPDLPLIPENKVLKWGNTRNDDYHV